MNEQSSPSSDADEELMSTMTAGMSEVDAFLCIDNLRSQVANAHAEKAAAALATLLPRIVEITWTADAEMGDEGQTYFNYSAASYRRDDGVVVEVQDPDACDSFVVSLVSPDRSADPTLQALTDLYEFRDTERHADLNGYEQVVALMSEFTGAASREAMHQAVDILWRAIYAFPAEEVDMRLVLRTSAAPH
jgi:hypothetical protein